MPCLKKQCIFTLFITMVTAPNAIRSTAPLYLPHFPTFYLTPNTHLPEGRAENAWEYMVEKFLLPPNKFNP